VYGVSPGDLTTLVAVAAVLLVVSIVATYIPSRRAAMRISPATALAG
jgi:ABC-type lipoprotein release transport system permease subunit